MDNFDFEPEPIFKTNHVITVLNLIERLRAETDPGYRTSLEEIRPHLTRLFEAAEHLRKDTAR
jgi:hypothetical protein